MGPFWIGIGSRAVVVGTRIGFCVVAHGPCHVQMTKSLAVFVQLSFYKYCPMSVRQNLGFITATLLPATSDWIRDNRGGALGPSLF